MAKSKKRSETAATDQSTLSRDESGNGQRPQNDDQARDRIAERAYELYLARGGAPGGDFDDWIAAERELTGSNAGRDSDRGE